MVEKIICKPSQWHTAGNPGEIDKHTENHGGMLKIRMLWRPLPNLITKSFVFQQLLGDMRQDLGTT